MSVRMTEETAAERFAEIQQQNFVAQAKWWLNGYWNEAHGEPIREDIWGWVQKFFAIAGESENATDLDEFQAHQFLEQLGETLTVLEMRERMRQVDQDNNKRMSVLEYLMFKYSKNIYDVGSLPQGDNQKEVEEAMALVAAAQTSLEEMTSKLEAAATALEISQKAEEEAKNKEAEAEAAKEEAKKIADDLEAEQKAFDDKINELEGLIESAPSAVKRGRAVAERDAMKSQDPLPLQRAKINQGAAVRKLEKARKAAEAARVEAEKKREESENAKSEAEAAVSDCEAKLQEALDYLTEAQKKPGASYGDFWWLEREIEEKKKYLPKSKQ